MAACRGDRIQYQLRPASVQAIIDFFDETSGSYRNEALIDYNLPDWFERIPYSSPFKTSAISSSTATVATSSSSSSSSSGRARHNDDDDDTILIMRINQRRSGCWSWSRSIIRLKILKFQLIKNHML
jgi:hypothetical protein